jgi:transcriptional regulator with XRE-family HTH domain
MTDQQKIAERLRAARTTLGLSQQDVADKLGIPRTAVSDIETAVRKVSAVELGRMARLYRRSVQWLLGVEDDVPADEALQRAVAGLPDGDKQLVMRFAQFLAAEVER